MNKSNDNGNIAYMAQNIAPSSIDPQTGFHPFDLGSYRIGVYQYDQLNRIKQSKSGFYENNQLTMGNKYFSNYSYDANGNITHLKRRDKGGNLFDDFTYNYNTALAGLENNKLRSVSDNVFGAPASTDIASGQSIDNYEYDAIGNLIADESDEIEKIHWTVYGKVAKVERTNTSTKPELQYFYDAMGNRVAKSVTQRISDPNNPGYTTPDWENEEITLYVRDASGNVMATYTLEIDPITDEPIIDPKVEYTLYGSSRLGITTLEIDEQIGNNSNNFDNFKRETGNKMYELSNHLGNVGVVINDMRIGIDENNSTTSDYYLADVVSATDYYPFGMQMPLRSYTDESYRFGFNGMEKDDEWKGSGNSLDFGARIYDSRLGRWLSVDAYKELFTGYSSYNFALCSPILVKDFDGNIIKISSYDGAQISSLINVINSAFVNKVVATVVSTASGDFLKIELATGVDINDLSQKEAAAFSNLSNMITSNNLYRITTKTWEINKTVFEGYDGSEIFPDNISNLPNEGYYDQLYIIDHFFIEQRRKNDNPLEGYTKDHENTENEQANKYGYKFGSYSDIYDNENKLGGVEFKIRDQDIIDNKGNYVATVRLSKQDDGKISATTYIRQGENSGSKVNNNIENDVNHFEKNPY